MITLGIDPSLTGFGWAIHCSTEAREGRVVAKGVLSTTAAWLHVKRYMYLRDGLRDILRSFPTVHNIGSESPPFGESFSEGLYGLYLYVCEAALLERKDIVFFDPTTLKMLVRMDSKVRRGTIDKNDVIDAARSDTGVKVWNHNEADAYIAGRSAAHFWEFREGILNEEDLTPSEVQAFLGKVRSKKDPSRTGGLSVKEDERFFRFSALTDEDTRIPNRNEIVKCPRRKQKPK